MLDVLQGLTQLSSNEFSHIYSQNMSSQDVYNHLENVINLRTFSEILCSVYPGGGLKETLINGLLLIDGANRDSVSKKVRDWLNGKYMPSGRDEFIKICFALKLSEQAANNFLSMASDSVFHIRNPKELTFCYCLRTQKDYAAATEILGHLKPLKPFGREPAKNILTKNISFAFQNVTDDESFYKFYDEHYDYLGELHNTSYNCFMNFINILARPGGELHEANYSIENIVDTYLRMNLPLDKNTSKYTVLQKTIRKYWPNVSSITKQINREDDVGRRILLLLYLVTEGGVSPNDDDAQILDEDYTDEERFVEHYWRLNSMLNDCGMGKLDFRNRFDWLILYCLKSNADEAMNDKMQMALNRIFETETS